MLGLKCIILSWKKCYGLQRVIDRQKRLVEDLQMKLQTKTKESEMHKDAYKIIRDEHVEPHVLESKDLKHMPTVVETSELRRAACIKMIQIIPANYLKPYQKSLEKNLPGQLKQNENFINILIYSILEKET